MDAILSWLLLGAVLVGCWFLALRAIPWAFQKIGRLLGFRMRASPLTERRMRRFRSIKRGYFSFVALATLFTGSLFLELIVTNKALYIRYTDQSGPEPVERSAMPAVSDWLSTWIPFLDRPAPPKSSDYAGVGEGEVDYRQFARWADDPSTLEEDAKKVEAGIAEDEARFREVMVQSAKDRGLEWDPASPLPPEKLAEYERQRAEAARLRGLRESFERGDAKVIMPLYPYSATEQLLTLEGPPPHSPTLAAGKPLLGTDSAGKDVLAQLLYGFRVSFAFAFVVCAIGFSLGIAAGGAMGYYGGWTDIAAQRFIEVWSAIPFLFTMMIVASLVSPGFLVLAVMLVVLRAWLGITYTVRGEFYREKARDYVQAARAIGVTDRVIMSRHILPNSLVPVITYFPFSVVAFIGVLVSLDFLGFGLPPEVPSWGRLLQNGFENVTSHPRLVWMPCLALAATLFAVVMVGEAVREAFDPRKFSRLR